MSDALADRVSALTDEVKGLREDTGGLRDQLATMRGRVWWVALVAVIALGLAGGIFITAQRGAATDARVDAICPLIAWAVGTADPGTREVGADRAAYERWADSARVAYVKTGCDLIAPPVPPRKPTS